MSDRLEQLLGVVSLAATDRLRTAIESELGAGGSAAGALVHLQAWPGCSVNDLADVLGLSQPAAVRLVDRLVDRGLVRRDPGPDGRTRSLTPTAEGLRAAEDLLAERAASLGPLLRELDADERGQLERLLGRVTSGLAQDRPGALTTCRLCDRDACQDGAHRCPLNHTVDGR
jgi:DNA-binding MarR family transcriptional regulator